MGMFDAEELADLRHHWHGAYVINGRADVWTATRTDDRSSLTATSAEDLRTKIRTDYNARPVPRPAPDTRRPIRKFAS